MPLDNASGGLGVSPGSGIDVRSLLHFAYVAKLNIGDLKSKPDHHGQAEVLTSVIYLYNYSAISKTQYLAKVLK